MEFVSTYYEEIINYGNLTDCIIFSFYDNMSTPDLNFICTISNTTGKIIIYFVSFKINCLNFYKVFLYQNKNYTEENLVKRKYIKNIYNIK